MRILILPLLCLSLVGQKAPELVVRTGHSGAVRELAFFPDGRTLLSSGEDGSLRFWDTDRGTFLRKIAAHSGSISDMAVCPGGSVIASTGTDGMLRLWAFENGQLLREFHIGYGMSRIAWLGDCRKLAVSTATAVAIIDLNTLAAPPKVLPVDEALVCILYLPERHTLIAGTGYSNSLLKWNSGTWEPLPRLATVSEDRPDSLDSSANGQLLVSYTMRSLEVLDPETFRPVRRLPDTSEIDAAAVSPDGSSLLTADIGKVEVWSPALQKRFEITGGGVSAAWSGDGKRIAVGDVTGRIRIFDIASPRTARLEIEGGGVVIGNVQFTSFGALRVFGAASNTARVWDIGPIEQETVLPGNFLSIQAAAASPQGAYLATFSAQQLIWWDLDPLPIARELTTKTISGWPLSCLPDGRCAWEETDQDGNWLAVGDVRHTTQLRRFSLRTESAMALALSPDGSLLAVGTNLPHVRVWSLADGRERPPLDLESGAQAMLGSMGNYVRRLASRKLILPHPDMPTALAFSPDGKLLAAANDHALHIWETDGFTLQRKFSTVAEVSAVAFGGVEKIACALASGEIAIWDLSQISHKIRLAGAELRTMLAFREDSSVLAAAGEDSIVLWDMRKGAVLANIAFTVNGGWIATAPNGAFDASDRAWEQAAWRTNEGMRSLVPVETYVRDYFAPGFIADLLAGRALTSRKPLASLDRNLPSVKVVPLEKYVAGSGKIRLRIDVDAGGAKSASDLRIYRNGRLILGVDGLLATGQATFSREFELSLAPGNNEITAAAFNQDGLRSQIVGLSLPETRSAYQAPITTLHIIAIGINKYASSGFNLQFARPDAESLVEALDFSIEEVRKSGQPLPINVKVSGPPSTMAWKVAEHLLTDGQATRSAVLDLIRQVTSAALPNDSVIIFYAGHSVAEGERFYLLPHDMKPGLPATYISDQDLEASLEPLDAAHVALILDSCYSGKVVEAQDRRGPLNARGLARLTYEKGMWVLAASQSTEEANEETGLHHGLLTHALVEEGLRRWKADPGNSGRIELGAWLRYAANRVISLDQEGHREESRGVKSRPSKRSVAPRQTPQFVPDPLANREDLILRLKTEPQ
jgi:WD40 repeat protein